MKRNRLNTVMFQLLFTLIVLRSRLLSPNWKIISQLCNTSLLLLFCGCTVLFSFLKHVNYCKVLEFEF